MTNDPLTDLYDDLPRDTLDELRAFVCSTGKDADRFLEKRAHRNAAEENRPKMKSRAS